LDFGLEEEESGSVPMRSACSGFHRILIVRAEPADEAALFLGGALVVEGDEAGEQRSGDHRSPRVLFTGTILSRRPVFAVSVGDALFGFADEVAALVEVDEAGDGQAVGIHAGDGAVEDVEVFRGGRRGCRRVRRGTSGSSRARRHRSFPNG
jgi:hypothetical protein